MKLTFDDALRITRAAQITAASHRGLDTQTAALHAMETTEHGKTEDDFNAEQVKVGGMPYGTYGGY